MLTRIAGTSAVFGRGRQFEHDGPGVAAPFRGREQTELTFTFMGAKVLNAREEDLARFLGPPRR